MSNTKLSNIYGLDRVVENIPSQIEAYTKEVREDVTSIKEKSLYYSEMSFFGIFTCIILCAIGASVIVIPDIVFGYLEINQKIIDTYNILIKICGCLSFLVGIHGIGKMLFARKILSCDKGISKIEGSFIMQFKASVEKYSINQMLVYIENCRDEELPGSDALDNKIVNSVEALYSRNKLMNKLTLISRIVLPLILYVITLIVINKIESLEITGVVMAFVLMIMFSRRLCLLLEYKVGKAIRVIMTIPALVYGILLYLKIKDMFGDMHFLSNDLYMRIPEEAQQFVSSVFLICLAQVIVLVLSVLFQDYYSEKKRLFEGIGKNKKDEVKHKEWYIYYSIVWHIVLFITYILMLSSIMEEIQTLDSMNDSVLIGVVFGIGWRLISPIWPESIKKAIREFWGAKYSIVVSAFVFVIIATLFFLGGFVFTVYSLVLLIAMIVSSCILFAIMVHIGAR